MEGGEEEGLGRGEVTVGDLVPEVEERPKCLPAVVASYNTGSSSIGSSVDLSEWVNRK